MNQSKEFLGVYTEDSIRVALRRLERDWNHLRDREAIVIRCRLSSMTLEAIGGIVGVKRERAAQMEAKGLRILKHPSRIRLLIEKT
jgi:DNA-directed RNA polymerase sigma subunit (sigma70/sigma32)